MDEIKHSYSSPRWTGEVTDCSLPVTFDTYSNCSFGCVYCFSQYQRGIGASKEEYLRKGVKSVDPKKIKRLFSGEMPQSSFWPYLKEKRPIQYGGLSDQFDGYEKKYGVTLEILKYLKSINYPICFSTKSTWVFDDERYREVFRGADNWNMKISIITLDEADAKKIEIGVPSPRKRLEAMRKYNELSRGGTTLRLRPFILGVSDKTYLDLIREAYEAGATAVSTEFFCLEMRSVNVAKNHYKRLSEVCGFDVVDFYRKHSEGSGYLRLNRSIKEKYFRKMSDLCDELGMRFYVSDAHFKECCENCCCCGLNKDWDYSRGNFSAALQVARKKGFVTWNDIECDMDFLDVALEKAEGLNLNSSENRAKLKDMTIKEWLRYLWNTPDSAKSPYKQFGKVLIPDGLDDSGDIIYKYNRTATFEPVENSEVNPRWA